MDNDFEKYKNNHKDMMDEFYKSLDGFGSASDDSFFKDLMGDSDLSAFGGGIEQTQQEVDVSDLERKIAEAEKLANEIEDTPAFEAPAQKEAPAAKSPFVPSPFAAAPKAQEPEAPAAFKPAPQAAAAPTQAPAFTAAPAPAPQEEPAAPSLPKWLPTDTWTPTMVPFVIRKDLKAYMIQEATITFMYGAFDLSMGEPAADQKLNSVKLFIDIALVKDAPPIIGKAIDMTIDEVFRSAIEDHERTRTKFISAEKGRQALFDYTYKMKVIPYRYDECVISYAMAEILEDGSYGDMKFFNIHGRNGSRLRLSDVVTDLEGLAYRIGEYLDYLPDNILSVVRQEIMADRMDFSICCNGILIDGILIPVVKNSDIFNVDYFNSMKSGDKAVNIIMSDKNGHICWDFDCDGVLDDVDFRPIFTDPGSTSVSAVEVIRNGVVSTFTAKDHPILKECVFAHDEAPISKVIIAKEGSYLHVESGTVKNDGYVLLLFKLDPDGAKMTDSKKVLDILLETGCSVIVREYTDILGRLPMRAFYVVDENGKYKGPMDVTPIMEGPFMAKIPFRARKLMYDGKTQGALETVPSGTRFYIECYRESENEFIFVSFGEQYRDQHKLVVKADQFVDPHAMIAGLDRPVDY
ncbi:MAG: hypothetical protein J5653_02965 [Clostridiales bacterium]|nr:hypothetical protein [Clostridiales bacterium]